MHSYLGRCRRWIAGAVHSRARDAFVPDSPCDRSVVILEDWWPMPGGRPTRKMYGYVTVKSAKEMLGFDARTEREANWVLIVSGNESSIVVPGCKILGVHVSGEPGKDAWVVH